MTNSEDPKTPGPGRRGVRYSRESERTFFFYATIIMLAFYLGTKLFGG